MTQLAAAVLFGGGLACYGLIQRDWDAAVGGLAIAGIALNYLRMGRIQNAERYRTDLYNPRFDLTRRMRKEEKEAVLEKFKTLKPATANEIAAFSSSDWVHPVYENPDWPHLAFKAFMDRRIDAMQMAKLFLFAETQKGGKVVSYTDSHGLKGCRIFDERRKLSAEVYQIVGDDGRIHNTFRDLLSYSLGVDFLEMQRVEEALRRLPPEETQFFLVPAAPIRTAEEIEADKKAGKVDLYNLLIQDFRFPLLMLPDKQRGIIQQIVIPPKLYQTILQAKFGPTAMAPRPILGYSPVETLSDPNGRIQGIPCPFVKLPSRIHGIIDSSNPLAFYLHDQAHLYAESANPHRKLWIDLALSMKGADRELFIELLDRNFPLYALPKLQELHIGRRLDAMEAFWYSLPYMEANLPGIWGGSKGADRIEAILNHLKQAGVSLSSLKECYRKETDRCLYSLKPWVDAAARMEPLILNESELRDSEVDDPRAEAARRRA